MADFSQFLPILLRHEGGWVDNPHDPGGATNKGVTLSTFKQYAPKILGVSPTLANLKMLTDEQAGKIYKIEYWDPIFGDEIQLQLLANIVCDFHVNAGYHAVKMLIKTFNSMGSNHPPDARLSRKVMDSLNHHEPTELYMEYKAGRITYYRTLVQEHPMLRIFLKGWLNRVESFPNIKIPGKPESSSC